MSRETIIKCDMCGTTENVNEIQNHVFSTGENVLIALSPNRSGLSPKDLCNACALFLLKRACEIELNRKSLTSVEDGNKVAP